MATLREIVDALGAYIETDDGLSVTCVKGYPDFRQLNLSPPMAALFYGGSASAGEVPGAVGRSRKALALSLAVYASNEVNLFALMQKLHELRARRVTLTAGDDSQPVQLYVGQDERQIPDPDDPKELRHWVICPVVLAYG